MAITNLKGWTIMLYMAGDNNLSPDMAYALEELNKTMDSEESHGVNLYIYFDGLSSEVPTLYCDFSNSDKDSSRGKVKFYPSYKIKNKLIDVKDEFNENSAAVNNIINFVDWCVKNDSAEDIKRKKYAFIFSGHTFGFVNQGLFKDEKADYSMTHSKLKYMFERITSTNSQLLKKAAKDEQIFKKKYGKSWSKKQREERTKPILGKPLDLLGFDTCVMSTLEIGCQFKKIAKTMVASEGSIPTAGWNYAQILLSNIKRAGTTDSSRLAISFVEEFIKQQNKFALADISVDLSAWNLKAMNSLETGLEELSVNLMRCFKNNKSVAYQQMKRLLVYAHWQCQTYLLEQHIDLSDFCQLLISEINLLEKEIVKNSDLASILKVKKSCEKVVEGIKNCILLTGYSGSDFQFSKGISLFFPWSWVCYLAAAEDYNKMEFIKKNKAGKKWNEFLIKYLSDVTLRIPKQPTRIKDINEKSVSVVYKSYELGDANGSGLPSSNSAGQPKEGKQFPNSSKQFPNSSKQFPNSSKQFPNSARQFPNSARMTDQFSIFLSRFMKLKNNLSNWNLSGFTSKTVVFRPESSTDRPRRGSTEKIEIKIPIE